MSFMRRFIKPFLLFLLIIIVFCAWFVPGLLSTFDFPYFSSLMMKDASIMVYAWGYHVGLDGFAQFLSPYSWVFPFIYAPQVIFGNLLHMDWSFITKIVYLYPYLILAIISPALLFKYLFPKNKYYLLSILIFLFNTYALMLAGGEVFLALAYALAPMILMIFMKIIDGIKYRALSIKYSIAAGLLLSIQIMLDPRITYIALFAVVIYLLFHYGLRINELGKYSIVGYMRKILYILVIPGGITILLQAFWILPTILHGGNPVEALGLSHSTTEAVNYFSFAKFENTISLLHPNWPENIFGKAGFMKTEFLLLPILAFASLFFIRKQIAENRKQVTYVLFFAFLGLLGAFLAKGASDPFGGIYLWMFQHVPGFIMFRDPTKWYLLVAVSYSVLIPFSVWKIYEWLKSKSKSSIFPTLLKLCGASNFQNVFLFSVICYLLFLIRPAIFGQLGGMLKTTIVPQDYIKLETFLYDQPDYFRTLWYRSKQRFGYYSNNHPEMSAQTLFNIYDNINLFRKLSEGKTEKFLEEASIKYLIIPYDSEKEIFITDRKYDNKLYLETINQLKAIKWLQKIDDFGKIVIFENSNYKDHFWTTSKTLSLTYKYISPVEYKIDVKNAKDGDLIIFSESYDKNWVAMDRSIKYKIESIKYDKLFNSFVLKKNGNYTLDIYYESQKWVNFGLWISGTTLLVVVGFLGFGYISKKW